MDHQGFFKIYRRHGLMVKAQGSKPRGPRFNSWRVQLWGRCPGNMVTGNEPARPPMSPFWAVLFLYPSRERDTLSHCVTVGSVTRMSHCVTVGLSHTHYIYIYKKRDTHVTERDIWVTGRMAPMAYLTMSSSPHSFKIELSVV